MQFFSKLILAASALASLSVANTVDFVNQDSTTRTVFFTPQEGLEIIPSIVIPGNQAATQNFPTGWIGNFYSVSEGSPNVPGMLGELRWDGFAGSNFFDVSAIVNPNDVEGVKELFPKTGKLPISGCQTFPCSNAYNKPDDVATLSTTETELVCLLGNLAPKQRRGGAVLARVSRDYVTGAL